MAWGWQWEEPWDFGTPVALTDASDSRPGWQPKVCLCPAGLLELGVGSRRRWGLKKQRIVLSQVHLLTLKSPKHKKASIKEHVGKGESKPLQAYRRGTENINRRLNFISIIKPNLRS